MFQNLAEDLRRYGSPGKQVKALFAPRVWAIVSYRFARWCHTARLPAVLRVLLKISARFVAVIVEVVTSIELPPQATIGPGLFIPHAGYVVVAFNARIGRNCTLTQGVSIGHNAGGSRLSFAGPIIGDRVYIGPGAAVLGPIQIGDDVLIGANAVVTRSVPARAVVAGNPARVTSMNGSFDLMNHDLIERELERTACQEGAKPELTNAVTRNQSQRES